MSYKSRGTHVPSNIWTLKNVTQILHTTRRQQIEHDTFKTIDLKSYRIAYKFWKEYGIQVKCGNNDIGCTRTNIMVVVTITLI